MFVSKIENHWRIQSYFNINMYLIKNYSMQEENVNIYYYLLLPFSHDNKDFNRVVECI